MSTEPAWQRARKPSQVKARTEEILNAAKRLFATLSYDEVSLNAIAREAGMSKPNVYRYFAGREEIFLQILAEEQEAFVRRLSGSLLALPSPATAEAIVEAWLGAALGCPDLLALLPQLGTSLERNSSLEQLVAYKKETFAGGLALAKLHQNIYPRLELETWVEVINASVGLLAGLWPLCNSNETMEQAMRHPEVGLEPWDFSSMIRFALKALISGAGVA